MLGRPSGRHEHWGHHGAQQAARYAAEKRARAAVNGLSRPDDQVRAAIYRMRQERVGNGNPAANDADGR